MTLLGAGVVVLARSPLLAAAMHEPDGTLPDTRTSEVGDGLHGLSV
jgi:hypothetical protein